MADMKKVYDNLIIINLYLVPVIRNLQIHTSGHGLLYVTGVQQKHGIGKKIYRIEPSLQLGYS